MSANAASPSGYRLVPGRVTAVLGAEPSRRALLGRLDAGSAAVLTVTSGRARSATERIAALEQACARRPVLVLVARLTDGLDATARRSVLTAVRTLAAAGPAVLIDDADPVAALAMADGGLRVSPDGSVTVDDLTTAGFPAREQRAS